MGSHCESAVLRGRFLATISYLYNLYMIFFFAVLFTQCFSHADYCYLLNSLGRMEGHQAKASPHLQRIYLGVTLSSFLLLPSQRPGTVRLTQTVEPCLQTRVMQLCYALFRLCERYFKSLLICQSFQKHQKCKATRRMTQETSEMLCLI